MQIGLRSEIRKTLGQRRTYPSLLALQRNEVKGKNICSLSTLSTLATLNIGLRWGAHCVSSLNFSASLSLLL